MMNKHTLPLYFFLSIFLLVQQAASTTPTADVTITDPGQAYTETILHFDAQHLGYEPIPITLAMPEQGGGSGGNYVPLHKDGPNQAPPNAAVRFTITLANYEAIAHTYHLTDTLPAELTYVPGSSWDLHYNPANRTLTWQGQLPPGNLDYVIEESSTTIPYIDLADFGAPNLCDPFVAAGQDCHNAAVTFNLGAGGYTAELYGQTQTQLTLSTNGLLSADPLPAEHGRNHWLPDPDAPDFVLAGLWREVNMAGMSSPPNGRWHAAIIGGLIEGHDLFYAQWHDAPHAADPNLTARHAIAVVLDGPGAALSGHVFYIYDNIANPVGTVDKGYTIGIEDRPGLRGATYAYAPCCDDPYPPQGYPPTEGTTLHLYPVLFGAGNAYSRAFSYQAVTSGQPPQTIANTAIARSSSADPALQYLWSTHYLSLRYLSYLPIEVSP
jgi:uncharacterized repeat protein (TIGR01451 family)